MTDHLDQILARAPAGVSLFLDFDGVLVDIAPTPDSVVVPDGLTDLLTRLEGRLEGALAVVSGRPLGEIDSFLDRSVATVFGSHGAQFRVAGETGAPDPEVERAAMRLTRSARSAFADQEGVLVEAKPAGVAVHYRRAPEIGPEIERLLGDAVAGERGFSLLSGKMVFEARPKGFDKGGAVRALMARPPFAGRLPVFVGDDVTDEDGMEEAISRGGYGIRVGPGESRAQIRMADPAALRVVLERLAGLSAPPDTRGRP